MLSHALAQTVTRDAPNRRAGVHRDQLGRVQLIILACLLIIGGVVRFYDIARPSLWMDELDTIEAATGRGAAGDRLPINRIQSNPILLFSLERAPGWPHLFLALGGVTHPPLYFLLLRWWMDWFGQGALAVRCLPALCSLAAIPILFDLCRLLHGPRVALLASAMMAVSVGQIDFAQDARSYAMLILLAIAAADALIRIEVLGATMPRLFALVILLAAAESTHYLAAGALLAFAAYAMLRLRGPARRQTMLAFVAAVGIMAAICAPAMIAQLHVWKNLAPEFVVESSGGSHFVKTFRRLIGLPGELLAGQSDAGAAPAAILIAAAAIVYLLPPARLPWRKTILLWVLWIFGAIGFVAAGDLLHGTKLLEYPRYTMIATPAICAALAAIHWRRLPLDGDLVAYAVIAALSVVLLHRLHEGPPTIEDWRLLSRQVDAHAAPDELLVFANPGIPPSVWYLNFTYYCPTNRRPWLILDAPADADLLRQVDQRRSLWLIGLYPDSEGPTLLKGWSAGETIRTSAGCACHMTRTDDAASRRPFRQSRNDFEMRGMLHASISWRTAGA